MERGRPAWGVEVDLTEVKNEVAYEDGREGEDKGGDQVGALCVMRSIVSPQDQEIESRSWERMRTRMKSQIVCIRLRVVRTLMAAKAPFSSISEQAI